MGRKHERQWRKGAGVGKIVHNVQHICRYRTNVRYATRIRLLKSCGFSGLVNSKHYTGNSFWAQVLYVPEIDNNSATCTTNLRQIYGKSTTNRLAEQQIHNKSISCGFAVQQI